VATPIKLPNLNHALISGYLTKDPEIRSLDSGSTVMNFTVARGSSYKDRNTGEWKEGQTCFMPVVVWNKLAEIMKEKLFKGSPVVIEGKLATRKWKDKNTGKNRSRTEIIASSVQAVEKSGGYEDDPPDEAYKDDAPREDPDYEDDIPF